MVGWQVIFYKTSVGESPVRQYIVATEPEEGSKITHNLGVLESHGLKLGFPHVSHLRGAIWELRIRAREYHRVLYFAASGRRFVLLHAFSKKTKKTPEREIQIAEERWADFLRRDRQQKEGED